MAKIIRSWGVALVLLMVAALAMRSGLVSAASGSATDPDETGDAVDVKTVTWSDSTTTPPSITLGFQSYVSPLSKNDAKSEWLFDLNGDGNASEGCALVKVVAGSLSVEFYNNSTCGPEIAATVIATQPTADSVQFTLPLAELQDAGLSPTATQYKFRMKNSVSGDEVPDVATQLLTHTLGAGSGATPTPSSGASPTPTKSPTPSPTPTKSPTPSPGTTPTPTPTAGATASPSGTPCPTATPTASTSPTPTPSASPTPTPSTSPTPSGSPTPTPSGSPTPTPSASPTPTPSATPTPTPSGSPTPTPSASASPTATPCAETVAGTPSVSQAAPGDNVQISGNGYKTATSLAMTFQSTPVALGSITSDTTGAFATTVKIPANATAGAHHILVAGTGAAGSSRTTSFPITVTSASTSSSDGDDSGTLGQTSTSGASGSSNGSGASLPRTGMGIAALFAIAFTLTLGGISALNEAKTRRKFSFVPGHRNNPDA